MDLFEFIGTTPIKHNLAEVIAENIALFEISELGIPTIQEKDVKSVILTFANKGGREFIASSAEKFCYNKAITFNYQAEGVVYQFMNVWITGLEIEDDFSEFTVRTRNYELIIHSK